jgi:hypothetical protein
MVMSGDRGARDPGQDQGAWRARIDAEIRELKRGVDVLFGKMDAQSGKLDAITTALHELRGAAGPSIKDILVIIATCTALFSAVSGGIIYLARGGNSEALHALDKRLLALEVRAQVTGKLP